MTTTIFLIRHGITSANKENRFAGRTGEPLHQEGVSQIHELGACLKNENISQIYTGPLPRTRQSAEILGTILETSLSIEEGSNEICIPHWDGLSKEEIRERFGPEYPDWLAKPQDFVLPGCETLAAVQERAVRCAEQIFLRHAGKKVLLVSHLIVLRCLILHYRGLPLHDFRSIKIDNGSVTGLRRNSSPATEVFSFPQIP